MTRSTPSYVTDISLWLAACREIAELLGDKPPSKGIITDPTLLMVIDPEMERKCPITPSNLWVE